MYNFANRKVIFVFTEGENLSFDFSGSVEMLLVNQHGIPTPYHPKIECVELKKLEKYDACIQNLKNIFLRQDDCIIISSQAKKNVR